MTIDDRDSLQESQEAAVAGNGHVEEGGAAVVDDSLGDVAGGSGYTFITKCLNCGEPLRGHTKKCPKCGYELRHSI